MCREGSRSSSTHQKYPQSSKHLALFSRWIQDSFYQSVAVVQSLPTCVSLQQPLCSVDQDTLVVCSAARAVVLVELRLYSIYRTREYKSLLIVLCTNKYCIHIMVQAPSKYLLQTKQLVDLLLHHNNAYIKKGIVQCQEYIRKSV